MTPPTWGATPSLQPPPPGSATIHNEYAKLMTETNWNTTTRIVLSGYAQYEFVKGLSYKLNVGAVQNSRRGYSYAEAYNNGNASVKYPTIGDGYGNGYRLMIDNLITYQNTFDKHNISVLLGHNAEDNNYENISVGVEDVPVLFTNVGNWAYNERSDGTNNLPQIDRGGWDILPLDLLFWAPDIQL